jgi:putative membrane protein
LITALSLICAWQVVALRKYNYGASRRMCACAISGWVVAAAAFVAPLCALSGSPFLARAAQQMILILAAAPLIAVGLPRMRVATASLRLWSTAALFFASLWLWYLPIPPGGTSAMTAVYWLMQLTLFGSCILLWRELLARSWRDVVGTGRRAALDGSTLRKLTHP